MTEGKRFSPRIGEVYLMRFGGEGSEQSGWRPGLIFQNNMGNQHSPNVIALPFTTALKRLDLPTHVFVPANDETGLIKDSVVLCENPECLSKDRIGKYLTTLPDDYMEDIAIGNLIATSAIAYIKSNKIGYLKEYASKMNETA